MKTTFKTFKEFLDTPPEEMMYNHDLDEQAPSSADRKKMRDFTYHHVQNTEKGSPNY